MNDAFYEGYALWTQVVAAVLFVVLMVVIWVKYIAPAVKSGVEKKNAELHDTELRLDEAKRKVDAERANATGIEREIAEIGARADRDVATLSARILAEAQSEVDRLQRTADGELERARLAGRETLRAEIVAKAVAIARERAATLDAATDAHLVNRAVDRNANA